MPKFKHYNAMSDKVAFNARDIIEKTISQFKADDDKVEVFIEDEFAINHFRDRNIFTFTRPAELPSIYKFDIYGEYIATIESLHPHATHYTLDYKKLELPDYKLLYSDKDAYIKQYIKLYIGRAHDCISTLLKDEKKVALVFTYRGKNDNPIVPEKKENDGILYIYCDIETGVISGYYSGIWVDVNMIKQIVGGIYGLYKTKNQ